ncbi:hypothetical protein [Acidimangrovimonas sediminis]|uniref:hypothetical protein n=1 Tax=Acidimangrovimonas sediminis TaxID=2056283 RepID=UPI000C80DB9C|nr:hypothetical protein [Acidimangrovimonas sediminis]
MEEIVVVAMMIAAMAVGAISAVAALLAGATWWGAVLVYAGAGSLSLFAVAGFAVTCDARRLRKARRTASASGYGRASSIGWTAPMPVSGLSAPGRHDAD